MRAVSFTSIQAWKLVIILVGMYVARFTALSKWIVYGGMFTVLIVLTVYGLLYAKDRRPITKQRLVTYALLLLVGLATAVGMLAYNNRL